MKSGARDAVLGRLRQAAGSDRDEAAARERVQARLKTHARNTVPARGDRQGQALLDLFVEQARAVDATVTVVSDKADVPAAIADYLRGDNLPTTIRMAPDPKLDRYPWGSAPMLDITRGKADGDTVVGVTSAFAAVAETGTLMMASGPESPTTLNFLPDVHIAVIRAEDMVGGYEDAWDRLRAGGRMPRAVNFVTGPSRSADIEQTLQLGAHGPRSLHIVLVAGKDDG